MFKNSIISDMRALTVGTANLPSSMRDKVSNEPDYDNIKA